MIQERMKSYSAEVKEGGYDSYGQPLTGFTHSKTVDVSISLLTKVLNELDPRYSKATHIGLTSERSLISGMRLNDLQGANYLIKIVNNNARLTVLTLEEC